MIDGKTQDTVEKQARIMVYSMIACNFLIIILLVGRDADSRASNRLLYEYHLMAVLHADSIYASYSRLRQLPGMKDIQTEDLFDQQLFISSQLIEYENMVTHIHSLLALHSAYDKPEMNSATERLNLSLEELRMLKTQYGMDQLGFALALTQEDFSVEVISQQLARLHKIGLERDQAYVQAKKFYIWLSISTLVSILVICTIMLWHRSLRVINTARDKEKKAIIILQETSKKLNEAQQLAKVGSWELDHASGTLTCSDEMFHIFEMDKDQFGASYEAFLHCVHPEDRDAVDQAFKHSLSSHTPYKLIHRLKMTDGNIKYVSESCETLYDQNNNAISSFGTIQDITELHKTELELRQYRDHLEQLVEKRSKELIDAKNEAERANQAKSEFLSRMSHELRTPMNAILGFAQILEMDNLTPRQIKFAQEIHHAGGHLLELINELLDLSRIEAGKMVVILEPVQINTVVKSALEIIQPLISTKQHNVINQCDNKATVLADPTRLRQILVNLLSNAAKYTHNNGHININCLATTANRLRINISDTGPGIPVDKQKYLFKPFERLGAEVSEIEGTGIGLALCKQLTKLMDGTIGFDSQPGHGSTFWVELTSTPETTSTDKDTIQADHITDQQQQQKFILYIEDNAANLRLVEAMFQYFPGLRLITATNGESGLELAQNYKPDAILLDIHLPQMNGYAVLEKLKADPETKDIPVIALSADAMAIDVERGLRAGFIQYLTKPIKLEMLRDVIAQHL